MTSQRPRQRLLRGSAWLLSCVLATAAALQVTPTWIKILCLAAAAALLAALMSASPSACAALRRAEIAIALDGDFSCIAEARHVAAGFLVRIQADHGVPVSSRAMELTQLVVSELVTNARKYAPGPALLELRIVDARVEATVWDSDPALPVARAPEPGRVGQHGLEIVMAVVQSFEARR